MVTNYKCRVNKMLHEEYTFARQQGASNELNDKLLSHTLEAH